MKPRDFLTEREFPIAIALTYSFDPVFFERVMLPALWAGGAEEIQVLADADEVTRSLDDLRGPLHQLGRRYMLSPVRTAGRFHPKLMLRFGRESGLAWVSTGNLTHGGWGLNRELAAAWAFGPEHDDDGRWVRPLLAAARIWAPGPLATRTFERIEELPWLAGGPILPLTAPGEPSLSSASASEPSPTSTVPDEPNAARSDGHSAHSAVGPNPVSRGGPHTQGGPTNTAGGSPGSAGGPSDAADATGATSRVLFSGPHPGDFAGQGGIVELTLGEQLLARWRGRRFDRLRLLTGSTDATGETLLFFANSFGVHDITAAVTRSRCTWTADALTALPLKIRLHCLPVPVLHAKAYHLSGPDGDVLLFGSPNCTRSAWTRPPSRGGNTELVLVYEDPSPEDLAFFGQVFVGTPLAPADALRGLPPALDEEEAPGPSWPIRIDRLEADEHGRLAVWVDHLPYDASPVELVLPEERINLSPDTTGIWRGRAPDSLPPGQTGFAHVEAVVGTRRLRSAARWIDDLRMLQEAGSLRRIATALSGLAKPASPREDERLLEELACLAHNLITDVQGLRDPFSPRRRRESGEEQDIPVVDPDSLIRSLVDVPVPSSHPMSRDTTTGPSLTGIFRALFSDPETGEGIEVSEDEEDASSEEEEGTPRATDPAGEPPPRRVAIKAADRFRGHMEQFIDRLRNERFQMNCTARQLVQAVGYPFAAATLGLKRGWADVDQVRDWLTVVATLLLHGDDGRPALLTRVRERYEYQHALDVFDKLVGEGTLWTVMTVSLLGIPWPGAVFTLKRVLLIRDLWEARVLRAAASPQHLAMLARRYNAADAVRLMRNVAAPIGASMGRLERALRHYCADRWLLELQAPEREPIDAGELVWGPANDWALTLAAERDGKIRVYWPKRGKEALMRTAGHFLSVRQVASLDVSLDSEYNRLVDLFSLLSAEA